MAHAEFQVFWNSACVHGSFFKPWGNAQTVSMDTFDLSENHACFPHALHALFQPPPALPIPSGPFQTLLVAWCPRPLPDHAYSFLSSRADIVAGGWAIPGGPYQSGPAVSPRFPFFGNVQGTTPVRETFEATIFVTWNLVTTNPGLGLWLKH